MMPIDIFLKQVPLFSQLSDEALTTLMNQGRVCSFAVDEIVFWEGDVSDAMFVILEGEIRVFKRDEEGNEFDINYQQQGECFGELALLDSQPRSASIICAQPCQLFKLEKAAFMDLLVTPETQSAAFTILSVLVERVRVITEKFFDEQLSQRTLQAEMEAERHRSLAQMVAGVAHELNTPLGVTNTAVDMIAKRVQNEQLIEAAEEHQSLQHLLEQMQEAARLAMRNISRAHKLVENFKKISVNQLTDTVETVNLSSLLLDILELFKINARQTQLQITVNDNLPDDHKLWRGYPGHLTQVLTNLLFNIERYAYPHQAGGKIVIALDVDEHVESTQFVLRVQDFGAGIAPEHVPQIFTPFFTTGRSHGGSGLGLSIVHNIVTEAMGGSIEVESTLGKGAQFTVTFPQAVG